MRCSFSPYEGKRPYIFVSYSHKDGEAVQEILEKLHIAGFRIWYDDGIEWGTEWPESIAAHLRNCSVCMPFHSKTSSTSPNCRQEIRYALKQGKTILSVYLEEVELTDGMDMQLSSYQSTFPYQYENQEKHLFYSRLINTEMIQNCREDILPIDDNDTIDSENADDIEYDEFGVIGGAPVYEGEGELALVPFEERGNIDTEINSVLGKINGNNESPLQKKINERKAQSFVNSLFSEVGSACNNNTVADRSLFIFDSDISFYEQHILSLSDGKHFSFNTVPDVTTLVFEINKKADYKSGSSFVVIRQLESTINYNEHGAAVSETFYVERPKIDGSFFLIIHINPVRGEVFVNNAVLDGNKVLVSKKPIRYFAGTVLLPSKKDINDTAYCETSTIINSESNEVWFPADINDAAAIIIDIEAASLIKREIYLDEETSLPKARIKLLANKTYFVFRVYETRSGSNIESEASKKTGRRPLSNIEKARLFRTGEDGFPKDTATAAKYYEKSSSSQAAYELATLFREDADIWDDELYKEYLLQAIEKGNDSALSEYALIYYESLPADDQKKISAALRSAADAGSAIAGYLYAYMVETGIIEGDIHDAFTYYFNSAQHYFMPARARLGCTSIDGIKTNELLNAFLENLDYGRTIADYGLGCILFFGIDLYADRSRGMELLKKAAVDGNRMAAITLLDICDYIPEFENKEAALVMLKKIVEFDNSYCNTLGVRLVDGEGCEISEGNDRLAFAMFEKAAASGSKTGVNNLGWCYKTGRGCNQDYAKAKELFEQAGTASSCCHLGDLYWDGLGVQVDKERALQYYRTAANDGSKRAIQKLKELTEAD